MMPWPPRGDEPIDWGDEPVEPPPPPSAGRSIRLAFSAVYDYAGSTIAASLVAFVVFFSVWSLLFTGTTMLLRRQPGGVYLVGLVLLLAPILLGPLMAGLYTLARAMFRHDDPHPFDILRGARRLARPAWALGYLQTLVLTVLVSDLAFLMLRPETFLKFAGIIAGYGLLFWAMMMTYQWPLLVEQGTPLGLTVRRSFLLAALNPFYTLAVTLLVGFLLLGPILLFFSNASAGMVAMVVVSLFWGTLIPAIHTSATLEILRKYPDPSDESAESEESNE